jgi:hypothetical protein
MTAIDSSPATQAGLFFLRGKPSSHHVAMLREKVANIGVRVASLLAEPIPFALHSTPPWRFVMNRRACCLFAVTLIASFTLGLMLLGPTALVAREAAVVKVDVPLVVSNEVQMRLLTPDAADLTKPIKVAIELRNLSAESREVTPQVDVCLTPSMSRGMRALPLPTIIFTDCMPTKLGPNETRTLSLDVTVNVAKGAQLYYKVTADDQVATSIATVAGGKPAAQLATLQRAKAVDLTKLNIQRVAVR